MKILLDTRMLIWALGGDERFPKKLVDKYLLNPKNTIFYSPVSLLEIDMKHAVDPEAVPFDAALTKQYCEKAGYFELQLRADHIVGFGDLIGKQGLSPNTDLYTHLLINQALDEQIVLFTHYSDLGRFSSRHVWTPVDFEML